jgi:hypothetical protein
MQLGWQLLEHCGLLAHEAEERRAPPRQRHDIDQDQRRERPPVRQMCAEGNRATVVVPTTAGRSSPQRSTSAENSSPCAANDTSCPARCSDTP